MEWWRCGLNGERRDEWYGRRERDKIVQIRPVQYETSASTMKLRTAILLAISTHITHVQADGELIASWVQFTGAGMQNPSCADRIHNSNSGQATLSQKLPKLVRTVSSLPKLE